MQDLSFGSRHTQQLLAWTALPALHTLSLNSVHIANESLFPGLSAACKQLSVLKLKEVSFQVQGSGRMGVLLAVCVQD